MDPASANAGCSTPSTGSAGVPSSHACEDPPDVALHTAVVARRQITKAGPCGSPVRRSPRLSGLPPPQPPMEHHDARDTDDSSCDESESVQDVALQLSRDDTPDNDPLLLDEPSTVLASRIMRAHDNPSPPPQDLARHSADNPPGKDGQLLQFSVSPPPSPFRPINLLERLDRQSRPSFDPSCSLQNLTLSDLTELPEPNAISVCPVSSGPLPAEGTLYGDLAIADTSPLLPVQYTIGGLPPPPSQHVCEYGKDPGVNSSFRPVAVSFGQSPTATISLDRGTCGPSSTCVDFSLHSVALPVQHINTMVSRKPGDAKNGELSSPSILEECKPEAIPKEIDHTSHQNLNSHVSHSPNMPTAPCPRSEPTSSIEQASLSPYETLSEYPPAIPPRTPKVSVIHPDLSRSAIQRPVVPFTPAPVRNSASPFKFLPESGDVFRTPAQRVPIETVLTRGTTLRKTTSTGSEQSARFPTIRTPVFKRLALDDPSRSPAKRIPVADLTISPARGDRAQSSPTRLSLRATSLSVESRAGGTILTRSRSVEPSAAASKKIDECRETEESIFPMVPMPSSSSIKLPFPFVTGQKSSSNLPPSIPEEYEGYKFEEKQNTKIGPSLNTDPQGSKPFQPRRPSANSRIPRIGNKPYARPLPKNTKASTSVGTAQPMRTSKVTLFPVASKNNGIGNSTMTAASTDDQRLIGSLKRKRGAEVTMPSNSHPVMVRPVVPGILNGKYTAKPARSRGETNAPSDSSPPKAPQPLKFRKVVDGMLSARYAAADPVHPEASDPQLPLSPLSELSSSSNEELADERLLSVPHPSTSSEGSALHTLQTDRSISVVGLDAQNADGDELSSRPRRTSRTRKPAQQQYVLDVFSTNTSSRPPPIRRKARARMEFDGFMGMSATALKTLTASNTTKNQQTVAVFATEVIRKEGLRPESPAVKARTILQKQQDERDRRRRERAQRRARVSEEGSGDSDIERQPELGNRISHGVRDENDCTIPQKYRYPGDDEDYDLPEKPERTMESLRLEGTIGTAKPIKQVKWHRGLSTSVYLDELDPNPRSLPTNILAKGCLAATSKNLPLDPLGNLADMDNRPPPELVMEQIVVKRYLYDNDIELESIPTKTTRSKSKKKSKS